MATIVTGEQYFELDGKLLEIKRQLRQKKGYAFDPLALNSALQLVVEGRFDEMLNKVTAIAQKPWQELLTACRQDWFNSDFTDARWPLEPVAPDESEWEVKEYFFSDNATGEEKLRRLAEMVKTGEIRLCGVRRAMEYVATHMDVQLDHPLVVSVSAQDSVGHLCLPAFYCRWDGFRRRSLHLGSVSGRFDSPCGWLVLSKRP